MLRLDLARYLCLMARRQEAPVTVTGRVEHGQIVLPEPLGLPEGTSVEVELRLLPAECWRGVTVEELAKRQQVLRPPSLDELAGDWPEEDSLDEFLANIHRSRN